MKLKRREMSRTFGPIWAGSGALGWNGEAYWFHNRVPGADATGMTLVSKTTTVPYTKGNMELDADYAPARLVPDCVWIDFFRALMLNSVALSGPGVRAFLATRRWQAVLAPFMISVMPTASTLEAQVEELKEFVAVLKPELPNFKTRQLGIQLNIVCPNVKADLAANVAKAKTFLDILAELDLPVIVKLNLLVSPETAADIASHPACSGICIANTIPFGELASRVDWETLFPHGSPLAKRGYGGGGLSGALLFPLVVEWVREFRRYDVVSHVNAGGGILHARDVRRLEEVGADSVFIASAFILRPWRVRSIVRTARAVLPI